MMMKDSTSKNEYLRRMNKVQDYIERNISQTFTLEELADVAGFSKYHFHRIFKVITNESLQQYINRFKLERSTHFLSHRLEMNITDIAHYLGYSDSAVFSRSFKQLFHMSPNEYRKQYRKNCKEQYNISRYNEDVSSMEKKEEKEKIDGSVEIIEIEALRVAYLRFTGNYHKLADEFSKLLERLLKCAYEQQVLEENKTKILSIYHDHPEFTQPDHFKTSLCITIPKDVKIDGHSELSFMEIPAGKYIVGHFYIHQHQYSDIWDYIYEEWLTTSGYVPSDSFPFEMYMNDYRLDENGKHLVDIYLPVEPLSFSSK